METEKFSRLCEIRKMFNLTQREVAELLGVSVMVVSLIERGVTKMKKEYEEALETFFKMPPGSFTNKHIVPIPVISGEIKDKSLFKNVNFSEWTGLYNKNLDYGDVVAVKLTDSSMEPYIYKDSLVYIKLTSEVKPGQLAAFLVENTIVIRQLKCEENCKLRSFNKEYDDILDDGSVKIEKIGQVLSVQYDWTDKVMDKVKS